jgi:hypothetical protein
MFRGHYWFAWYPVTVRTRTGKRIAWLETVWRDEFHATDGTRCVRFYQH